jgi:hypothetical protein
MPIAYITYSSNVLCDLILIALIMLVQQYFVISSQRGSVASYGYVPSSPILVTLMMEAPSSPETSFLTRTTKRNIPEDAILHIHRRGNLKSYIALTGWTL